MTISIRIDNDTLTVNEPGYIVSGSKNYYELRAVFTPDWNGLNKYAVFPVHGCSVAMTAEDTAIVPEALTLDKGVLIFGFIGLDSGGNLRIATNYARLKILEGAHETDAEPPSPDESETWEGYIGEIAQGWLDKLEEASRTLEIALAEFANSIIGDITIPASGWQEVDGLWRVDVPMEAARVNHFPIVAFHEDSRETVSAAELLETCEAADYAVRFWAKKKPGADINVTVALLFPQHDGSASGGGGGSGSGEGYVLKPATDVRLGGVKIGKNIGVTVDGIISTDAVMTADVATDDDLQAIMKDIFGEEQGG